MESTRAAVEITLSGIEDCTGAIRMTLTNDLYANRKSIHPTSSRALKRTTRISSGTTTD
jgi:hypothetical protein